MCHWRNAGDTSAALSTPASLNLNLNQFSVLLSDPGTGNSDRIQRVEKNESVLTSTDLSGQLVDSGDSKLFNL